MDHSAVKDRNIICLEDNLAIEDNRPAVPIQPGPVSCTALQPLYRSQPIKCSSGVVPVDSVLFSHADLTNSGEILMPRRTLPNQECAAPHVGYRTGATSHLAYLSESVLSSPGSGPCHPRPNKTKGIELVELPNLVFQLMGAQPEQKQISTEPAQNTEFEEEIQ